MTLGRCEDMRRQRIRSRSARSGQTRAEAILKDVKAIMKFYTDPGYKERHALWSKFYEDTARMCVEAALALVDMPKSERAGGVCPPL